MEINWLMETYDSIFKGELVVKSEEYIIIEVQGIGYKVFMSKNR